MSQVSGSDLSGSGPMVKTEAVRIWVVVGTLHGCDPTLLDDPKRMEEALNACTRAGGLTLLHSHIHRFEPQGVTASAVLAESHIALHSWPEQEILFFDIATCSNAGSSRAAFAELCERVPHTNQKVHEVTAG